jgi:DNA modification methylase
VTHLPLIEESISSSGHSPMYVMHKFFGRKQGKVIREYIKNHTENKNEIVLDPFCGSGVMIGEALRLGRRAIGIDVNPVSIFITKNTLSKIDSKEILNEFNIIQSEIKHEILSLYKSKCKTCQAVIPVICFTWKNSVLFDKRYECPEHGRIIEEVCDTDRRLFETILARTMSNFFTSEGSIRYWFPDFPLYYTNGVPFLKKEQYERVDDLFTLRNLIALAKIRDRITKIKDSDLRDSFLFAFSSMVHLSSRMTPVRPSRPFSSAWVQQSYWSCPHYMESNVWFLFERAIQGKQGLIRAKKDLSTNIKNAEIKKNYKDLRNTKNLGFLLLESSITKLNELPQNSIDYVITDPPYGHSIQYGELLYLWGAWLNLLDEYKTIFQDEIVVNSRQKKDLDDYEELLYQAFKRVYLVLKPGRYCTITFHNPSLTIRNVLYRSVIRAGFNFEQVIYQKPARASAKSLLQPAGSQRGDYFFRFKKPEKKIASIYSPVNKQKLERWIIQIVVNIITTKGKPMPFNQIQNSLDPILYKKLFDTKLLMTFNPRGVEEIMKENIGKIFQLQDNSSEQISEKKKHYNLWTVIKEKP